MRWPLPPGDDGVDREKLGFLTLHFNSDYRPYLHFNIVIYKCFGTTTRNDYQKPCITSQELLEKLRNWGCFLFTPKIRILWLIRSFRFPKRKMSTSKRFLERWFKIPQCLFHLSITISTSNIRPVGCLWKVLWEWNLQVLTEIAEVFRLNAKQTIIKPCKK